AVLRAVATKIAEQGGDSGVVVFADQFEELPAPQAASALRLLLGLVRAADETGGSLLVVLTLRWESLAHVLTDDNRAEVERGLVPIGHMTREQLRDAIVLPARRAPACISRTAWWTGSSTTPRRNRDSCHWWSRCWRSCGSSDRAECSPMPRI